ncbi:hypothetical protein BRADI_3g49275v3 [Brachypodium distachyon]|uniref:Uncharacterized protein n=1 Tax=Brachypodium distachyon TaxID=15368 RepID=A0A2K2D495_BRADI|nr:hypothetical protein BRADI_3g49275v3 [Brachypodium distachyon]
MKYPLRRPLPYAYKIEATEDYQLISITVRYSPFYFYILRSN